MTALGVAPAAPHTDVSQDFRHLMKMWPSGVSVVTTQVDGAPYGFTASSFTSVSMHPPMISVCLDRSARCAPAFAEADWISVNVLGSHQDGLAGRFASKLDDKFNGLTVVEGAGGAPAFPDSLGVIECRLDRVIPAGDHLILLANVHRATHLGASEPLAYYRSAFAEVSPRERAR
ncbi:flavin reductase family protein [Streptomyces sp. NBC_00454]|uniref:flavin reductase family protein n=1 Tax=Streptomyces sp. NBC_00454 TaxID=2975747 RepID=UPI00324D3137